jgi:tetratricopeptide (TPR) repeat protein
MYGRLAYWQGEYQQANVYYKEAILLSERIGDQYQNLWAHVFMAYTVLQQGQVTQARALFEDSLRRAQQADITIAVVFALEGFASLMVRQEQFEHAVRLIAWADATREKLGDHRPPVEQAEVDRGLAIIHSQLDDTVFEKACQLSRTMTQDEAVAYALKEK